MPLTKMQTINIDGVLDFLIETIQSFDKSNALTALQLSLSSQKLTIPELVFLNNCKDEYGDSLTPYVAQILSILVHEKPQLAANEGGLFNLVRRDADAGGHYPSVGVKEVREYIRGRKNLNYKVRRN